MTCIPETDLGFGTYSLPNGKWVDVRFYKGNPVSIIWGPGTMAVFRGVTGRIVAAAMPEIGTPVEEIPAWCLRMEIERTGMSPEEAAFRRKS